MKSSNLGILTLALCSLAACSTTNQQARMAEYKAKATSVQALEVPPDLTIPSGDGRFNVPGADGDTAATYSSYAKMAPDQQTVAAVVLPVSRQARIERDGARRWLVVDDKAENVWGAVRSFWIEQGFLLESDDAAAGVIVTDWLENRANLPQSKVRSTLARVFDSLRPYGERDQFRIRLERSKDGASTEIYVSHHGLQESAGCEDKQVKWLPRSSDAELENIMLQKLQAKLAASGAGTASDSSRSAANGAATVQAAVRMQENVGGKSILIEENFEKAWRKVSLALDKAGIAVEDKNRAEGLFFLKFAADGKKLAQFRLSVHGVSGASEISVMNAKGQFDKDAQRVIDLVFQNIEK